jgi:peptide deformylase
LATRRIVTTSDPDAAVLRNQARDVRTFDRELRRLVADMVDTMRDAPGVGLAAPQLGIDLRVIVVETAIPSDDDTDDADATFRLHAVVNPVITWRSEDLAEDEEACLSIPGLFGDVPRHVAIRIQGRDTSGRPLEIEAQDFEARVFQHEVDHLDGVLFPDRVTSLEKLFALRRLPDGTYERIPYALPA